MKNVILYCLAMILSVSAVFAQPGGGAWWEPEKPDPGETITIYYDVTITNKLKKEPVKMHWGINKLKYGAWNPPPESMWPEGTTTTPWSDGKAVQSEMIKSTDGVWELTIPTPDSIRTIDFVLTDGSSWDSNTATGLDYEIDFIREGEEPVHEDTITVDFLVDLAESITSRGFSFGDTLEAGAGYFTTATEALRVPLTRVGFTTFYTGQVEVVSTIGGWIDYQYFLIKRGTEYNEVYYNFFYDGEVTGEAQRRRVKVESPVTTVVDTVASNSDERRMPFFRNVNILQQDVAVTLTCDLRPAIYTVKYGKKTLQDIQGDVVISHVDSILAKGLAVNGPVTGSWSNDDGPDWGPHLMTLDNKAMFDDGTHGDAVAGDSIFTAQFNFFKDSADVVGQEFKFGIGGGDNEGGFGNNHIANIDDSQPTATIAAQFGSIDPIFYDRWDFDAQIPTVVQDRSAGIPDAFTLEQNYPNPFNPTTTIAYRLPQTGQVTLDIFNVQGQKVRILINKMHTAGAYQALWDGLNDQHIRVSSGLYFYRIQVEGLSNTFMDTKKMMFVK